MLRTIVSGELPPTANMGLDEALLLTPGPPTLRLYGWSPPGVSLGYFQSSAGFRDLAGPHVLVRRLTGGGAIYHDAELTFALTVDATTLPAHVEESYELIHAAVARALHDNGVQTSVSPGDALEAKARPDEPWCLMAPGPADLLAAGGGKILGSAQRRVRRPRARVLHHGSLVLRPPAATPACGSVSETADADAIEAALRDAVAREIAAALDLSSEPGEVTEEERRLAHGLAERRYESDAFTHRR